MSDKTDLRLAELERLRRAGKGILRPEAVVEAATDPKNVLHDQFEWDDGAAGQA